jgi:predicted nuclease of predicted toxin-antitoxin system
VCISAARAPGPPALDDKKPAGHPDLPVEQSAPDGIKFLIDECLHESLVGVAHRAGAMAAHVNYLGLSGKPDWAVAQRIKADEFTFVTNNRADFIRLFAKMELHLGLIILIPNAVPALQQILFQAAIDHAGQRDLFNTVIEVTLDGRTVRLVEYQLPAL